MQNYFDRNAQTQNDNCIECHNKGMRILLDNNNVPVGSQADITRSKMQATGFAGETQTTRFTDVSGNVASTPAEVTAMQGSLGAEVQSISHGTENSVFGISINDGYHTATLSVHNETIPILGKIGLDGVKPTQPIGSITVTTFTLSDQGTRLTNDFSVNSTDQGNMTFNSTEALDSRLTQYVQDSRDTRTRGGYEYPAKIEYHRIQDPQQ